MRSIITISLGVALLTAAPGCKDKKPLRGDEDVKAVVAEDRRITEKENELLARRGVLQRERNGLRDKRVEIITKKMTLPETDSEGKQELEQEESKLARLEASLVTQELTLNKKLQSLLDQRTGLVDKLGEDKSGKDVLITRREYSVALREKDFARREGVISKREKILAAREQALAERQARGCPKATTVVQSYTPPSSTGGGSYTRKDVEPVYRAALKAMNKKGVLTADLPAGADRLVTEVRHSVSKGDYVRAKYAADQLLATVRKMKINRGFIGTKIDRLSRAIKRTPPSNANREKVNTLFQQATANYGDGRFIRANSRLNRIYSLLR